MPLRSGIVGLPNVGKSTIFNALTKTHGADAQNFPFCTIDPNVGLVKVPDPRFQKLVELINPKSEVPAVIEFVDIAGLVKGASQGEGLGNQFLSHIRQVDAILHILRCFEEEEIVHVSGEIDPQTDLNIIESELILSDLEIVEKRLHKLSKLVKAKDQEAISESTVLNKLSSHLKKNQTLLSLELADEEQALISHLGLITMKPTLLVGNVHENDLEGLNLDHYQNLKKVAEEKKMSVLPVSAKIESELIGISADEEKELLKGFGLQEPSLNAVIRETHSMLGYLTFFTAGEQEVKAWNIKKGTKALDAAGTIHTDIQRGFIRAEVISLKDILRYGSTKEVQRAGKMRLEGKDYKVQDSDVIYFRFNV